VEATVSAAALPEQDREDAKGAKKRFFVFFVSSR
jgi:hypothetical protein